MITAALIGVTGVTHREYPTFATVEFRDVDGNNFTVHFDDKSFDLTSEVIEQVFAVRSHLRALRDAKVIEALEVVDQ